VELSNERVVMKKTRFLPSLVVLVLASHAAGKTVPNNAAADLVLGQPDFVTGGGTVTNASSLSTSTSVVVDPMSRKVFVGDEDGDRVLRYSSVSALMNGASAEAVFGQARFSGDGINDPTAELGMSDPDGLFLDRKGRLWVADTGNNRVLMFEAAVFRNTQPFPDVVLGQNSFTTTLPGTTATTMKSPKGVWVDTSDRLWVADSGNNRVLRFDAVSNQPSTGASADGVLGQVNLTTGTALNSASRLQAPTSVAVSPTGSLFVANSIGNRVFRFDAAAGKPAGANAEAVFGQASFATITAGLSASQMDFPRGLTVTADDTLWVCDAGNNRVIRFGQASTQASGSLATGVVGQADFTTTTSGVTSQKLNDPGFHPFVDGAGALWVPDRANNRVLRFPSDETLPLLFVTTALPKSTKAKKLTLNGTASDAFGVARVQFKVNAGPLKTATGTTTWQAKPALKKGKNTITLFATDSVGNVSVNKIIKIRRK
jgi:sugar lactone lactonase YvrE